MTGEKQSEVYLQETHRWRDDYEKLLRDENARLKSELEGIRSILISFTEAMETVRAYCGKSVAHDSALERWEVSLKTCNDILNRVPK